MRNSLWILALLLVLPFGCWTAACGNAASDADGGDLDAEDGGDVDPCQAAATEWNEIWQVSLDDPGIVGVTPATNIMDVWGADSNDIYAVGFNGTILHYDGTAWTQMPSNTTADLEGVWGYTLRDALGTLTRKDVFAAGSDGSILRFDGTAWVPMLVINDPDPANPDPQAVTGNFHDIWGIPAAGPVVATDHPVVIAVGGDGLIARYDGATNRFLEMRQREEFTDSEGIVHVSYLRWTPERIGGVFGDGSLADPLFVAVGNNGTLLRLDQADPANPLWIRENTFNPPGAFITHLNGVWGRGAFELFATGLDGTVLRRDNGGTWEILKKLNPLWDLEPVYLRGSWAFVQSFCGELPEVEDGGTPDPDAVREDTSWVIFIGWNGTVLMGHDGLICELTVPTENRLESIWGKTPRAEDDRWIDNGGVDGGIACDPVEVVISGVNGTLLRLSNPEGR